MNRAAVDETRFQFLKAHGEMLAARDNDEFEKTDESRAAYQAAMAENAEKYRAYVGARKAVKKNMCEG